MSSIVRQVSNGPPRKRARPSFSRAVTRGKRMPRYSSMRERVYDIERTCQISLKYYTAGFGTFAGSSPLGKNLGISFQLSDLVVNLGDSSVVATGTGAMPGITELTTLFQEYKIVGVKLGIHYLNETAPTITQSTGALTTTNASLQAPSHPFFYMACDYNDDVPVLDTQLLQHGGLKQQLMGKNRDSFNISLKPRPQIQMYYNNVISAYAQADTAPWINCDYAATPHYGVKVSPCSGMQTNTNVPQYLGLVNITCKYSLRFRTTK